MKMRVAAFAGISALVVLGGCVTPPEGPTVPVMPAHGKPFAQFQREDGECQDYAESRTAGAAKRANDGAGLGAAIGGGQGAAIGAASGAVVGTAVGTNDSRFRQDTIQGRYNLAYAQCMQSHGNRVPDMGDDEGPPPGYDRRGGYNDYPPPPPPPPPGY